MENIQKSILLICTGLGRVNRGFEQYISSLSGKLPLIGHQVLVASGGKWAAPNGVKSIVLKTLHRNSWLLRNSNKGFVREQQAFALALLPYLIIHRPALIYLGEYRLYCYLYKLRKLLRFHFSLCLYTGGQAIPGEQVFDKRRDYVHHITPAYLEQCKHLPTNRQLVLPHFIQEDFMPEPGKKSRLRAMAFPKKIVLSVGLLDRKVKQMHLLADMLGRYPEKWFPVLLGANSADTDALRHLFAEKFGEKGFLMENVLHPELASYYEAADIFVSYSPRESFGLAMVEALYHGLPVVAPAFYETKWVLNGHAQLSNLSEPDVYYREIQTAVENDSEEKRQNRTAYVLSRFCWEATREEYELFFTKMLDARAVT